MRAQAIPDWAERRALRTFTSFVTAISDGIQDTHNFGSGCLECEPRVRKHLFAADLLRSNSMSLPKGARMYVNNHLYEQAAKAA